MNVFDNLKNKLLELKRNIYPIISDTIEENEEVLRKYQTSQLYEGKDSEGKDIIPSYAASTIRIKTYKGQPTDRVTLKDKGNFYERIKFVPQKDRMYINDITPNGLGLQEKYGKEILGLNPKHLSEFATLYILPNIRNNFLND